MPVRTDVFVGLFCIGVGFFSTLLSVFGFGQTFWMIGIAVIASTVLIALAARLSDRAFFISLLLIGGAIAASGLFLEIPRLFPIGIGMFIGTTALIAFDKAFKVKRQNQREKRQRERHY